MIPLWLTPKVIKGGLLGAIIMLIFFTGFYARGKLDANKIARAKAKVVTIQHNYDLSMENLDRCLVNYDELRQIVSDNNKEVVRMNKEYEDRVLQLQQIGREAISRVNATHDEAIADMVAEASQLRQLMAELSQSEACHLAMLEIVK
jgi:hypothetical protein